jgi:hypothetical protein
LPDQYDMESERDRWRLFSTQLQLKQELLHRATKDILDKSSQLKTRGREILTIRREIREMQVEG